MSNYNRDPTKTNGEDKDLENQFKSLVKSIKDYFPRVDEILILDILRLEYFKPDWQGTTTIEIQYSSTNAVKLDEKKDKLYDKFQMLPMEKNENTLRFKAKKMFLKDIEDLFHNDSDIVHITGSATPSEDGQYPSSQ